MVEDDLVYYENRVIIPKTLKREMLKRIHDTHQGVEKTKQLAKQHVYYDMDYVRYN